MWKAVEWFHANMIPIDLIAISEYIAKAGIEIPTTEILAISSVDILFIRNIDLHVVTLKEYTQKRRLSDFAMQLADNIESHLKNPSEALQTLQTQVAELTITSSRKKRRTTLEIADSAMKLLDERSQGIFHGVKTGIRSVDRMLDGGFAKGTLNVIGARPSIGKSALCAAIARNVAKEQGGKIIIVSYEMKSEMYLWRVASGMANANWRYPTQQSIPNLSNAMAEISGMDIEVWDDISMNAAQMQIEIEETHRFKPIDLLIVDYLQRMPAHIRNASRRDIEISEISHKLKDIAMKLNIPVVALSSLNRKCEERNDKRPQMADLKESGDIESDADVILSLYRPEYYKEEMCYDGVTDASGRMEIHCLKNREGATGSRIVNFNGEYSQVWDMEQAANQYPPQEEGVPF